MEPQQLSETLMIALGGKDMLARLGLVIEDADLHFLETIITARFRPGQGLEILHPRLAPLLPTDRMILAALVFLRLRNRPSHHPVRTDIDSRGFVRRRPRLVRRP